MVSDRTLQRVFGMRPQTVELWGTPIRGFTALTALLICAALAGVYTSTIHNTVEIRRGQDFGVFYESALSAEAARAPHSSRSRDPGGRTVPSPNLNPPHFSAVVLPFTWVDLPVAFRLWIATSALMLLASVVLICRSIGLRGWSVAALCAYLWAGAPMITTLLTGQVGLVLLLPFTLAWAAARRHQDVTAAAWIGLCASIKPFFLLFVPYWVVRRQYIPAAVVLGSVMVIFAVGMALYGVDAYRAWLGDVLGVTWAEHYMNASLLGVVERSLSASEWGHVAVADIPPLVAPVWTMLWAGICAATLWRVRVLPNVDDRFLLVTSASLLLSPFGWVYYFWLLAPPVVAVVGRISTVSLREVAIGMALAGVLVPPFLPLSTLVWPHGLGTTTSGSIYFWSLAALWVGAVGWRVTEVSRDH